MKFHIEKDPRITGRYLTFEKISPILNEFSHWKVGEEGQSVLGRSIPLYQIGNGAKKILLWSQMHGNESTTTKALLDFMLFLKKNNPSFLENISIFSIPMLNPDGAFRYTRTNANEIDLNRDAIALSQPESQFLRQVFNQIHPDFCFNLHDQRTIFSTGKTNQPATVSFLAPAENELRTLTTTRKIAMELITHIVTDLQQFIPNKIGRFNDDFNPNCTGDQFTMQGVPTLLFEAGHFPNDYQREVTRQCISQALFTGIQAISQFHFSGENFQNYFNIPENEKLFFDVLIKNDLNKKENFSILFQEIVKNNTISFEPIIQEIETISNNYGHLTLSLSEIYPNIPYQKEKAKEIIFQFLLQKMLSYS